MPNAAFRVLYLLTEPFITGGVQSDMKSLGPYFVEKGHEVFIACPPGDQIPHLDKAGVTHTPLDVHFRTPGQLQRQANALRKLILELKPTVIAPQSIRSSWVAYRAAKDLPVLRITTIHNIHTPIHGLWSGFLLNRFSDLVIFESDHEYKRLTGLGLSPQKARVVPSGIDTRSFHPASPNQEILDSIPCLKKNGVTFGCIARLSVEKAHSDLLKAFKQISIKYPDASLILVGEGPTKPKILALIDSLDLASRVYLAGQRSNIPEYLNAIDVFVLASRFRESLPRAAREAMACGKPIIATRMGALREVVQDGENGFLVPIANPSLFAQAMEKMITDPALRKRMGDKSHSLIQERFRLDKWLGDNELIYQKASDIGKDSRRSERIPESFWNNVGRVP